MNTENERQSTGVKSRVFRIALDGMLCALAIVGRIALSALPNIQPVTAIIIIMAAYLGLGDAIAAAIVVVLVTNLYLGMGIWTLYQMLAWAIIAVLAWLLFRKRKSIVIMLIFAVAAGFLYGFVVSLFSWKTILGGTGGFWAYWLAGLLFDGYHALGNAVFIWFLKPLFELLYKNTRKSIT